MTEDAQALRFFNKFAKDSLKLTTQQRITILGGMSTSSFYSKLKNDELTLGRDEGDRLAWFIKIYEDARGIFGDAASWLLGPHTGTRFKGEPPINRILRGGMEDLIETYEHLSGVFGGWGPLPFGP